MKKVVRTSIKAETDTEMTARHMQEETATLTHVHKLMYELYDTIEDLHDHTYETMELGALYEELGECLRAWRTNKGRLNQ